MTKTNDLKNRIVNVMWVISGLKDDLEKIRSELKEKEIDVDGVLHYLCEANIDMNSANHKLRKIGLHQPSDESVKF